TSTYQCTDFCGVSTIFTPNFLFAERFLLTMNFYNKDTPFLIIGH